MEALIEVAIVTGCLVVAGAVIGFTITRVFRNGE